MVRRLVAKFVACDQSKSRRSGARRGSVAPASWVPTQVCARRPDSAYRAGPRSAWPLTASLWVFALWPNSIASCTAGLIRASDRSTPRIAKPTGPDHSSSQTSARQNGRAPDGYHPLPHENRSLRTWTRPTQPLRTPSRKDVAPIAVDARDLLRPSPGRIEDSAVMIGIAAFLQARLWI